MRRSSRSLNGLPSQHFLLSEKEVIVQEFNRRSLPMQKD